MSYLSSADIAYIISVYTIPFRKPSANNNALPHIYCGAA